MTFDTLTIPAQTILTTVVSVSVSTSTVLAPQCSNLVASPVNYQPAGILVIAGVGGSATVSAQSPEDCCSHCATNQYCFAFSYGVSTFVPLIYSFSFTLPHDMEFEKANLLSSYGRLMIQRFSTSTISMNHLQ